MRLFEGTWPHAVAKPAPKPAKPKKEPRTPPTWRCNLYPGVTVSAWTKGEARGLLKLMIGEDRLPVGAKIYHYPNH